MVPAPISVTKNERKVLRSVPKLSIGTGNFQSLDRYKSFKYIFRKFYYGIVEITVTSISILEQNYTIHVY